MKNKTIGAAAFLAGAALMVAGLRAAARVISHAVTPS